VGIWTDMWVAPERAILPDQAAFGALLVDLARDRIVRMPWTIIAGRLDVNATLLWGGGVIWQTVSEQPTPGSVLETDQLMPNPDRPIERAQLVASGHAIAEVIPALAAANYGDHDVAVIFPCLNFENPEILKHYWEQDRRTVLVCFALAPPQGRVVHADLLTGVPGGLTHQVGVCIANTFKFGEQTPCPAIDQVARRHFGQKLAHGFTQH
jgi:hypothetical protein